MAGSWFFALIVAAIGIVCAIVITPILWIPVGLILVFALLTAPFFGAFSRMIVESGRRGSGSGTPSTSDATYDPVDRPEATPRG